MVKGSDIIHSDRTIRVFWNSQLFCWYQNSYILFWTDRSAFLSVLVVVLNERQLLYFSYGFKNVTFCIDSSRPLEFNYIYFTIRTGINIQECNYSYYSRSLTDFDGNSYQIGFDFYLKLKSFGGANPWFVEFLLIWPNGIVA
jgi:hypothetical protein